MGDIVLSGLSPLVFTTLVLVAGLTSMLTASLGAGGGVMLLGVMAQILPTQVIIPLHGVVQLGSNAGRATMSWKHINWRTIGLFLPGAIAGALIGKYVLVVLPYGLMYLTIAVFILYLCWGPKLPKLVLGKWGIVIGGVVTTFLTLFVGATGPIVAAFIKQISIDRFRTVATFAAAMSLQHICKIVVFENSGFDLKPWLPLLLCMIISGVMGTWVGLRIMKRLPEQLFQNIFNWVLTLLALRLIWQGLSSIYVGLI